MWCVVQSELVRAVTLYVPHDYVLVYPFFDSDSEDEEVALVVVGESYEGMFSWKIPSMHKFFARTETEVNLSSFSRSLYKPRIIPRQVLVLNL